MLDMVDMDEGRTIPRRPLALSAQQTNLVRSILRDEAQYLNHPHSVNPKTGVKTVTPLEPQELSRFLSVWDERPVGCIRSMNRAIASVREPERSVRYLMASFDLEVLLDRSSAPRADDEFVGIPVYLKDGYTDLGFSSSRTRREKILVDKERLKRQLVSCKRQAVEELSRVDVAAEVLETHLRDVAQSLRDTVGYTEVELGPRRTDETVCLSESIERRAVACRHLSILMQLRLQESGITSRLVKGVLRLYGLKGRHAWNVVSHGSSVALVDVTFAEDNGPLVIVGASIDALYQRAAALHRLYIPSPDTSHHYRIRRSSGSTSGRDR